jgi:uncharacterized membrane protein
MLFYLLTSEAIPIHNDFIVWAEHALRELASFLKIILEFIAILIIAIALLKSIRQYIRRYRHSNKMNHPSIRLELGLTLALSLEFLLAADIVGTAVSPSWDAIAKLAAITGIRTFLNFFLHREVQELQKISQNSSQVEL